jgi:hypothetical protein
MDSMRHDLRAALDEVPSEAIQTPAVTTKQRSPSCPDICWKCSSPPAPGGKLRYCGRCAALPYCSKQCAKEDWAEHKLVCASMRTERAKALAAHVAQGGRKQDFNQIRRELSDDVKSWFAAVPGLVNEVELLAWSHRGDSPFIHASASDLGDAGGSDLHVEMIPRSLWDEDPRFLEYFPSIIRGQLRQIFDAALFCPTKKYVFMMTIHTLQFSRIGMVDFNVKRRGIRGVEIAEALTTATKAEDLADAFAWIGSTAQSHDAAQILLQHIRDRALLLHGTTTSHGSVPVQSRALNSEVAYLVFASLQLEFDVRLTGLCSAAHLNGRQGVIRGQDPGDNKRWKARLDDGTWVSVKAVNFEHIPGNYRHRSP